ncbi:tautomerase family protein [Oxalobacteraceae bacterium CAVE-383]|nr:tautomerase family protein [Oxalobacteraceae bacterium CAVE-383]
MPFVRVSVPQTITDSQLDAISDAIHVALIDTFNVPVADRFQLLTRHPASELVCTPEYLGIRHSDRVAFIQITVSEGRTLETKKALYAAIAASVAETGAVAAADVIVMLIEGKKENWSFGNGIAQYAV